MYMLCVLLMAPVVQLPMATTNALLRRWRLGRALLPTQEEQAVFLDMPYDSLLYAVETGSTREVVERLTDMAA
jgi:hypothetical protein